jgi:methylmalonyl-CoA mutase cobalamin-binding domain/chain
MTQTVAETVIAGKLKKIEEVVQESLDSGDNAQEILDTMTTAMSVVGDRFQRNEIFVPEMLVAAMTLKKGVTVLKPLLAGDAAGKYGKFIIGTVAGDLHDIGKNLVALMVESAGFEIIDLGVDVPAEKFIEAIKGNPDCRIVGLSALLTTTMDAMKTTVKAISDAGLKSQVKILVGGAPITEDFAKTIGADAYATDAGGAAVMAKEMAS